MTTGKNGDGAESTNELDPKDPGQLCNIFPILSCNLYLPVWNIFVMLCWTT